MHPDDFRQKLFVDKHELDREVIQQPQYYYDVAKAYAIAVSLRDEAKDKVREVQATRLAILRRKIEAEEKKAPSETRLASEVLKDALYREAVADHATACRTAMEWEGMVEAWRQRSHALKTLADLHQSGYFQVSAINAGGRDRAAELAEQNKRRIAELRQSEKEEAPATRGRVKVTDDDS